MALINNTFFIGDIYLPELKPSLKDDNKNINSNSIIDDAEFECLERVLGPVLAKELYDQIDLNEPNLLKSAADNKWVELLYGLDYTDSSGNDKSWKGILYKSNPLAESVNSSFLANYCYFVHERVVDTTRAPLGHIKEQAKNSKVLGPNQKVSHAWNKFVDLVQGELVKDKVILITNSSLGAYGLDYYSNKNNKVSLYCFIQDINSLQDEDIYENFSPTYFERINEFL